MKTDFKVLMTLMGMEIGGAETHVLELCKRLKSMGVDVIVASNGGSYVRELESAGILHYEVPLHNKNPYNLLVSYRILKKIILENDIRLVHAHARIPAFLCGLLHKKLHFRFVTTCHGVYSTGLPFKILTNWGERALAVSEDIKRYLIDNYGLDEQKITVTVNGLDTEKFSGETDFSDIVREFKMDLDKKRIVYVSRLDKESSKAAHALLDCAEEIYALNKKLEIFIVGGGTDYDEIRKKTVEINNHVEKKLIFLTGPRTDINKLVASADLFVGISRAALEAMAAEKPVILAGDPGYLGIFDESKLSTALETNFCCRGCEQINNETLKKDILKLLKMKKEELDTLGKYGRSIVLRHYSVQNMTQDALSLYEQVLKPDKTIDAMIIGYYGTNNHGDDVILKTIRDDLRTLRPDICITIISQHPRDTQREYSIESLHRFNLFKILSYLKKTNLLIYGGGTLIQDLTSTKSLLYYLLIINLAKKRGARVMLYANGIGPVSRSVSNRMYTSTTLNKVDLITLRDYESEKVLKELKVNDPPVVLTADPAFGIKNTDQGCIQAKLEALGLANKKYFCVSVRNWKYLKEDFEKEIISFCEYVYAKHHIYPLFIPMQPSYDAEISRRIIAGIKNDAYFLGTEYNINEILGLIGEAEFVLGMRLHAIIYAAKTGTPVIGLVYDPKVKAVMDRFGQEYYCNVQQLSGEALRNFADFVIVNKDMISDRLKLLSKEAEDQSFISAKLAVELMDADCF